MDANSIVGILIAVAVFAYIAGKKLLLFILAFALGLYFVGTVAGNALTTGLETVGNLYQTGVDAIRQ